jgi:hypothetical protein
MSMDLESHAYLCDQETAYYERTISEAEGEVRRRAEEKEALEASIGQLREAVRGGMAKLEGLREREADARASGSDSFIRLQLQARLREVEEEVRHPNRTPNH